MEEVEYVERQKVVDAICALDSWGSDDDAYGDTSFLDTGEVWDTIAEVEAADVQPVRHGHWSNKIVVISERAAGYHEDDVRFGFQCSVCGGILNKTRYCGNCGAKMDEGGEV